MDFITLESLYLWQQRWIYSCDRNIDFRVSNQNLRTYNEGYHYYVITLLTMNNRLSLAVQMILVIW